MQWRLNWGTGIAAVYALFACSTMGFVVFAMNRPADLVSADYYQRSLQQDERIAAEANARTLIEPVRFAIHSETRRIIVTWPSTFRTASGEITLYRPSNSSADRRYAITPASGEQTIDVGDLASGRWRLQAAWTDGGRSFYQEAVITLP
jgi:hypothetical protein